MSIEDRLHRLSFDLKTRAETWQMLADFTSSGMEISLALETVASINDMQGRKSVAHIMREFRNAMAGGSIAMAARRFASETDRLMFSGEGDIEAAAMFAGAARVARGQLVMRQAVRSALLGPSVLMIALAGLYIILGKQLFPSFRLVTDRENWPVHARALETVATGLTDNLILAGAVGGAVLAAVVLSLPVWTGFGRSWADRVPPWSLMRMQTGLTFLLLLVESGRMGRSLTTAWLLELARISGPYVASRIRAIARRSGGNPAGIGAAALRTGHNWPTVTLTAALAAYARQPDWLDNFASYLENWMRNAEANAKVMARVANMAIMGLVAATVGLTIATLFALIEQAQSGSGI